MAIAVVGAVRSLAPAEPFAQARAQSISPGVRLPMTTRVAVERPSSVPGPMAAGAVCTEQFTALVTRSNFSISSALLPVRLRRGFWGGGSTPTGEGTHRLASLAADGTECRPYRCCAASSRLTVTLSRLLRSQTDGVFGNEMTRVSGQDGEPGI